MNIKLIITFLLVLTLAFLTVSCAENDVDTTEFLTDETQSEIGDTVQTDDISEKDSEKTEQRPGLVYKVLLKNETKVEGNTEIGCIYPEISGYSDAELEKKANALMRSYIDSKVGLYTDNMENITCETETMEILARTEEIFSARCALSVSSPDFAYPTRICFGINLDLKNARMLSFTDLFDYDLFKIAFVNGDFKLVSGYENLLDEKSFDSMIEDYNPDYSLYPDFYVRIENGSVKAGMIYETIHVLGDYAVFEDRNTNAEYFKDILI